MQNPLPTILSPRVSDIRGRHVARNIIQRVCHPPDRKLIYLSIIYLITRLALNYSLLYKKKKKENELFQVYMLIGVMWKTIVQRNYRRRILTGLEKKQKNEKMSDYAFYKKKKQ